MWGRWRGKKPKIWGGLVKTQTAGSHPKVSESMGPRTCISNTFSGETTLGKIQLYVERKRRRHHTGERMRSKICAEVRCSQFFLTVRLGSPLDGERSYPFLPGGNNGDATGWRAEIGNVLRICYTSRHWKKTNTCLQLILPQGEQIYGNRDVL